MKTFLHILEYDYMFPTLKCSIDRMLPNSVTRSSSLIPLSCNTNLYLNSFLPRTARNIRRGDEVADE